jgi:site-specific DNA-methyltransferase (adenine-specific)
MSNPKDFRYEWIWEKNAGSNFATLKYQPMKEHENICVFSKETHFYYPQMQDRKGGGAARSLYGYSPSNTGKREVIGGLQMTHVNHNGTNALRFPSSVQRFNRERGLHPTQKPVDLLRLLVRTYSLEGETVLDFTMGCASTGVAAAIENRNFIGIENNEEYFNVAKQRLLEVSAQPKLFTPEIKMEQGMLI